MSRKILVVGGAGYIGSHVLISLIEAGFEPIVVDNLSTGSRLAVKETPLYVVDILDETRLDTVFKQHIFLAVMHFAAFTEVENSVLYPDECYRQNVVGSLSLFRAMQRNKVAHLIFSSTAALYGNSDSELVSELNDPSPINPYGTSKWMVESILKDFYHAFQWKYTSLRYFNAAGCDRQCRVGLPEKKPNLLIPVLVSSALKKNQSFTINGTDYPTFDGTCVRDFVHVSDLARAHVLALKALLDGKASQVYNLGGGKGVSVKEVVEIVKQKAPDLKIIEGHRRIGDPVSLVADVTKAKKELGWEPLQSDIDTLVNDTWRWYSRTS